MDDVRWYYEGRNGWWQYDDRTNDEVEAFHARGESKCELLIAGFLYIIDFEQVSHMTFFPQARIVKQHKNARYILHVHIGFRLRSRPFARY